jgi:hypothetical protein
VLDGLSVEMVDGQHCVPTAREGTWGQYPCQDEDSAWIVGREVPKSVQKKLRLPDEMSFGYIPDPDHPTDPSKAEYIAYFPIWEIPMLGGRMKVGQSAFYGIHNDEERGLLHSPGLTFDVSVDLGVIELEVGVLGNLLLDPYLPEYAPSPYVSGPAEPLPPTATPTGTPTATATATATATRTATPTPSPTLSQGPTSLSPVGGAAGATTTAGPALPPATPLPSSSLITEEATAAPTTTGSPTVTADPAVRLPAATPPAGQPLPPTVTEPPADEPGLRNGPGEEPSVIIPGGQGGPEIKLMDPVTHTVVGTCADGRCGLNMRAGPDTDAEILGVSLESQQLEVECQTIGTEVSNGRVRSSVWNKVKVDGKDTWVSDLYMDTPNYGTLSYPACT